MLAACEALHVRQSSTGWIQGCSHPPRCIALASWHPSPPPSSITAMLTAENRGPDHKVVEHGAAVVDCSGDARQQGAPAHQAALRVGHEGGAVQTVLHRSGGKCVQFSSQARTIHTILGNASQHDLPGCSGRRRARH